MFNKNFIMIFLVGIFAFPGNLIAEEMDEEKQALIKELITITNTLEMFETVKQSSVIQFEQNIIAGGIDLTPEQMAAGKEAMVEVFDEMQDDLLILIVKIYGENYSNEELGKMLSFYKTELGQMFINKMPQVTNQVMQGTSILIQKIQPIIQSRMAEKFQALEKNDSDS